MPIKAGHKSYFHFLLVNLFLAVVWGEHILSVPINNNASSFTIGTHPTSSGLNSMPAPLSTPIAQVGGMRHPQVPLDVEGYPVAPEGLKLEQVHVYVRHGERTPVSHRMHDPPANIPEHWFMCNTTRRFRAAASSYMGSSTSSQAVASVPVTVNTEMPDTRRIVEGADGIAREGNCLLGELTDLGRQTTYLFGQNLRLYVDRLGFLPDVLTDNSNVYFRSTNVPRTIESLQQIIHGLYPTHKYLPSASPAILVRNGKDENLIGNSYACKRLDLLIVGFARAAAETFNVRLQPLDKKLSKYIGGNPIRVDGKPRVSGIMDSIRAAGAHGIKVPPEFEDESVMNVIEQAVVNEWLSDKTEEVRRLGMGRLLSDMSRKMQTRVTGPEKSKVLDEANLKILVHSTHDTALAALCATLEVFDEKLDLICPFFARWPAFTASIIFELFKQNSHVSSPTTEAKFSSSIFSRLRSGGPSSAGIQQYYVRTRYQNRSMNLPLCAAPGDHLEGHPEFCTLSAFQRRVAELTPVDWDDECSPAGRK